MKILLRFVLIIISTSSFAQTAIKLNAHFQYSSVETSWKYNTDGTVASIEENKFSILPLPTISIFNFEDNFYELGLSKLDFGIRENQTILIDNRIRAGEIIMHFEIGFRYDYNFALSKSNKRIKPISR